MKVFYLFLGICLSFCNSIFADKIDEKKVVICGAVKDSANFFKNRKKEIEKIGSLFKDYAVVIYENNSSDSTKSVYQNWALENKRVTFLSEDLSDEYKKSYTPNCGDFRTEFIARARNKTLDIATSHLFDSYDYVIMMDLDDFEEVSIEEFIKTIENPEHEWDGVFANGSYDLYALRSKEFPLGLELTSMSYFKREIFNTGRALCEQLIKNNWYPVDSFFGGFAIYKRQAVMNARYSGKINRLVLQNAQEHHQSKDLFTRACYQSCLNEISQNYQKQYDFLVNNIFPSDGEIYVCEHVTFNLALKSLGYNRLFINAKLARPSRSMYDFFKIFNLKL